MRTVFPIRDVAGRLIAEHVRLDTPSGKRMFWQLPDGDPRDGLGGLSTAALPLYGSPQLRYLPAGSTVIVTEGERAAEALFEATLYVALGTVTGASGTPGEDALSPLLPFDVVTWEDDDEPGLRHMERVAASLIRLGVHARRLRWASQNGVGSGADAVDFIAAGGTDEQLAKMVRNAPPWQLDPPAPKSPVRPSYDRHEDDSRRETARSHLLQVVEQKLGAGKRSGQSIWWCCPFHAERTPSFKVDLREPYYICHGCGARGDVFTFLRAMEGVEFKDALLELAPPRLLGAAIPW